MKNRNILIVVGIVIILIIAGWWWFSQNQITPSPTPSTTQSQTPSFFPVGAIKDAIQNIITTTANNLQEIILGERNEIETGDQPIEQIIAEPVADYGFITYQSTSTLFYIEQNTGYIFVMASNTPVRLSNKSIPRIKEVKTAENNSRYYFYISSLDEQNDLIWQKGELLKATSSELALTAMAGNIKALEVSSKGDQVFVLKEVDGTSLGQIMNINLEVPTTVFISPFTEWVVEWVSDTKISFQTKPSSGVNGSIYLLDVKDKSFTPVITNIPGLMTIFSNENNFIYSSSNNGEIISYVKKIKVNDFYNLPNKIITNKCGKIKNDLFICGIPTILPNLNYPDAWYQGLISFNDQIWMMNLIKNTTSLIDGLNLNNLDIINIKNNNQFIYFQNKIDGSLWSFDLTNFDF